MVLSFDAAATAFGWLRDARDAAIRVPRAGDGRWAEVEPAVEALLRHCDAIGRNPREIEWSVGVEPDDIERFVREDAWRYVEMGFTQFTLGFGGPAWRVEGGLRFLEWRDRMNTRAQAISA